MQKKSGLNPWIASTCLAACLFSLAAFAWRNHENFYQTPIDFLIFLHAQDVFDKTGELYQRSDDYEKAYHPSAAIFKFPPAYQLMILPFAKGVPAEIRHVFTRLLLTGMYILSVTLLFYYFANRFRLERNQRFYFASLLLITGCWFMPFFESIRWLLTEIPLLLLFIGAFLLMDKWRKGSILAGMLLGYAASAKIYPAFMLAYPLVQRNRQALVGVLAGIVGSVVLALWVFGAGEHLFYLQHILPVLLHEGVTDKWVNLNLEKFLFIVGVLPEVKGHVFQFTRALFLGGLGWLLYEQRAVLAKHSHLVFSLLVTTMFFCFPNYWPQYQIFLIIPLACLLALCLKEKRGWSLALLLLATALLFIPDLLWQDFLTRAVEQQQLDMDEIGREAWRDGTGPVLLRYSFLSWLCYYTYEYRALVPVILWLMQAQALRRHHTH